PLCCRAPISLCQRLAPPRTLSYAPSSPRFVLFFLNAPSTTQFYSLSLHDALPIFIACAGARRIEDDEVEGRRRNGAHRPHPSGRSEEHTSELQSRVDLVCRLLLEKKKNGIQAGMVVTVLARSAALSTVTRKVRMH